MKIKPSHPFLPRYARGALRTTRTDARQPHKRLSTLLIPLLLTIMVAACVPTDGPFSEYYVSPAGVDDPRLGTTADDPWRTIQFALDRADYSAGTPRINLAAGTYRENLAISRPVTIVGAGAGEPGVDTGISVIIPAVEPSDPIIPFHTVSGGVRAEFHQLVFQFGRLQVTGGTLYMEDVVFWGVKGRYGLRMRDVSAFTIVNSDFTTPPRLFADLAVETINSIGEIHGGYFGELFDHVISITRLGVGIIDRAGDGYAYSHPVSHVLIEGVTIHGSKVYYADGVRISFDSSAIIRNSTIIRDHADAEPWLEGTSDGSAAGIDILYIRGDRSSTTVELEGNTISGFDVGIAMNLGGIRVKSAGNDISGVSYPIKTHYGRHPEVRRADPTLDFGGGPLGSSGGNIFRPDGTYAFFHQHEYQVDACFNDWSETGASAIEARIHDQMDDPSIGRVRWNCSEAIIVATPEATPEVHVIFTLTPTPQEPTIKTDTLCWKGPGPLYEVISSVKAGTEVILLGRGEVGSWWIIDNPRFPGVACWLPGDDLDVELELLPAELLIFVAPPIPTPTATPILGCLYQGQNDPQAICYPIDQCPVPFDQSQGACAP